MTASRIRQTILTLALFLPLPSLAAPGHAAEPDPVSPAPQAASQSAAPSPVTATAGPEGFALRSADGDFVLRLRALIQADGRAYSGNGPEADGFLMRRARLELGGTVHGTVEFRLTPEFAGASTTLLDAWLRWNASPALQVQAGKVKLPVGLERAQSREHSLFNELGYPTALVPNRDVGLALGGELAGGALAYTVGVFDGTPDGGSVTADGDDEREWVGRLFATPFASGGGRWKHVGLGIAGTHGSRGGAPASYRTVGQQTFFRWRDGVENDGTAWRVVPQLYAYRGPFGLIAEHAVSRQRLAAGPALGDVRVSAWSVGATWVLTGEDVTFGGVVPSRPAGGAAGGRGALQLVARATALEVERGAFPLFADPASAARGARTASLGGHWIANRNLRLSLDFHHTELDGGPLDEERAAIGRAQLRF